MNLESGKRIEEHEGLKTIKSFEYKGQEVSVCERENGLIGLDELNSLAEAHKTDEAGQAKRVLLVDFKTSVAMQENEDYIMQNFMNLGVHRMAGYLNDYDIPVTIARYADLVKDPEELQKVLSGNDIIGVSHLTAQVEEAYALARQIKKQFGAEKLVVGGSEHYLAYDRILADQEQTGIDACCLSQGELPLLALALGQTIEKVGSLAYRRDDPDSDGVKIIKNKLFDRLIDGASHSELGELGIMNTRPAEAFSVEEVAGKPPFPELEGQFDATFVTQTGSGCLYGCDFCPAKKFFPGGYKKNLGVAMEEVLNFKTQFPDSKEVFMTFADAMLNPSEDYLKSVVEFMRDVNREAGPKISWFAYLSAPRIKKGENLESWRGKWDSILGEMAEAGCVMAGVGVEEIIYDRNKVHSKGQGVDTAAEFIDLVGKHMLVRSLLIFGAPEHFHINRKETLKGERYMNERYPDSDRKLIKGEILEFMKAHPQALYRTNPWTLVYGTDNFYKYEDCLADDVSDPAKLKLLDHLHSVIDPEKMYARLERESRTTIPSEKRWVQNRGDWFVLMEEVMSEYAQSDEYSKYLETLKDKEINGRKGILYDIAIKFKENLLAQIDSNRKNRDFARGIRELEDWF